MNNTINLFNKELHPIEFTGFFMLSTLFVISIINIFRPEMFPGFDLFPTFIVMSMLLIQHGQVLMRFRDLENKKKYMESETE